MIPRKSIPIRDRPARPGNIADQLRLAGVRPTAIRIGILGTIERMRDRFSVEDIYRQLLGTDITTSVGTVYRVLADLETAGILKRDWVSSPGGPKAAFTIIRPVPCGDSPNRHRLLCRNCSRSAAILEPATLELLGHFCGWNSLEPPASCMVIETNECAACRTSGPQDAPGTRLIALPGGRKPEGQGASS